MNEPKSQQELIQLRKRARRRLVGAVVIVSAATLVLWNVIDGQPQTEMHPEKVDIVASGAVGGVRAPAPDPAESLPPMVPAAEPVAPPPGPTPVAPSPTAAPAPARETRVPDAAAAAVAEPVPAPAPRSAEPRAEPKPETSPVERKPSVRPAEKPADKPAEQVKEKKKADPAAILNGMADADAVAQKPKTDSKPAQDKSEKADKADKAKSGRYLIQVAALSDPDKAAELKDKLAAAGVSASVSQVNTSKGTVSRIRVGPFASEAEARAALTRIQKAGMSGILVPQ